MAAPNILTRNLTTCRICKQPVVEAPALDIPLDGPPDKQTMQYLTSLFRHVNKRHPDQLRALMEAKEEFGAMLLFQVFQTDDASVNAKADLIKDTFVNQFSRNIADEDLTTLVSKFDLPAPQHAQMIELATSLRDLLTCRGKYAPNTPALKDAPLIVTR